MYLSTFAKDFPFSISSNTEAIGIFGWEKVDEELVKEAVIKIEGFQYNSYNIVGFNLVQNRIAP